MMTVGKLLELASKVKEVAPVVKEDTETLSQEDIEMLATINNAKKDSPK